MATATAIANVSQMAKDMFFRRIELFKLQSPFVQHIVALMIRVLSNLMCPEDFCRLIHQQILLRSAALTLQDNFLVSPLTHEYSLQFDEDTP